MCAAIKDVKQTRFHLVSRAPQIFQTRKIDANKQDVEMKLNLTWKIMVNKP